MDPISGVLVAGGLTGLSVAQTRHAKTLRDELVAWGGRRPPNLHNPRVLGERTVADEVFFEERSRLRRPGIRRSLARARGLAAHLGIDCDRLRQNRWPVIAVVGSKGKGTTATFVSATLSASGMRVGTLTSPGFRSNRERIRVDGNAIGRDDYAALVERVHHTLRAVAGSLPADGYLSPTGLFTLAGLRHFLDTGCDAVVLEAGMGGWSDEISLLEPTVVAATSIFAEHIGSLGDSVESIAIDKLGIVGSATVALVSVVQTRPEVMACVVDAAPQGRPVFVSAASVPDLETWPPGLVGVNARLGVVAAEQLLDHLGRHRPAPEALEAVWRSVHLPGRLSVHPRGTQTWALDAAINGTGAGNARAWCERTLGRPDTVVVSVPDGKDRAGVLEELDGLDVITVRVGSSHLDFSSQMEAPLFSTLDRGALGERVLALGTISFIGEILEWLDVPTESSFTRCSARVDDDDRRAVETAVAKPSDCRGDLLERVGLDRRGNRDLRCES